MMIHDITKVAGKHRPRKRVGRGEGSGIGGTSTRGHNGAKSRAGWSSRPGYQGGATPFMRRFPKRGFKNGFRTLFHVVNVQVLDKHFENGATVDVAALAKIGLVPDAGSIWADLRVGELKTMLALAAGDVDAIREGCEWVRQFAQLDAGRRRTYRCIETLLDMEDPDAHEAALVSLYGDETLDQATDMIDGDLRFFGLQSPGLNLEGCAMHQCLLKQYEKAHPNAVDA